MGWFWFGLAYVVGHSAGSWLLASNPSARAWFGTLTMLVPPVVLAGVIVARRRTWTGCAWLFWATVGVGALLWAVGHLGWTFDVVVFRRAYPWLAWHTLFTLAGGAMLAVAVLALPHLGPRDHLVPTLVVDLAAAALLLFFLMAYFVLVPSFVPNLQETARRALLIWAQAIRLVLLAALVALALRVRGNSWARTYRVLAGAVAIGFLVRAATSLAIVRGHYSSGTAYDLAWIIPFLGYTWAAASAPASVARVGDASPLLSARPPWIPFVALALVPVVGYGVRLARPYGPPADGFRDILTAGTVLALLSVLAARFVMQRALLREASTRVRLLAAAMQQTAEMILIARRDLVIEEANDAACRAFGYGRGELTGRHIDELLGSDSAGVTRRITAALEQEGVWRGMLERRRKDDSTFPAACTVVPLTDERGQITHFVDVERDITEELRVRDRLIQTERLSALGELAAGVAHEINNPLQTILGRTELLLGDGSFKTAHPDVEVVRQEASRVAQIVHNLLSFVRRSPSDRAPLDLGEIVRGLVSLRAYPARQDNIVIEAHLPDEPLVVRANRDGIQQVLTNLLLNAEHAARALPGQGTVTVRAWGDAEGVYVEVADDGTGVSPEVRPRIFEPFFTTKPVGEGTGLGLSTALGIARAHGGTLELVPSARGACFRLTLPTPDVAA